MASSPPPPPPKPLVYFVTGNQNKLREVVAILEEAAAEGGSPLPCEVRALDIDLPELQGDPRESATAKAEAEELCEEGAPTIELWQSTRLVEAIDCEADEGGGD